MALGDATSTRLISSLSRFRKKNKALTCALVAEQSRTSPESRGSTAALDRVPIGWEGRKRGEGGGEKTIKGEKNDNQERVRPNTRRSCSRLSFEETLLFLSKDFHENRSLSAPHSPPAMSLLRPSRGLGGPRFALCLFSRAERSRRRAHFAIAPFSPPFSPFFSQKFFLTTPQQQRPQKNQKLLRSHSAATSPSASPAATSLPSPSL